MRASSQYSLEIPPKGRVFTIISEVPRASLHWLAMLKHEYTVTTSIYTRLAPQRLAQHIDLSATEFNWLAESMDDHALSPSLERIHHSISTRIASDSGIIWLDAIEYLISRQGFDAFLSFTRSLADEISRTEWTLILPFSPLSMEATQLAHIRREATPLDIGNIPLPTEIPSGIIEQDPEPVEIDDLIEVDDSVVTDAYEFLPKISDLSMLSTITESALSTTVLERRISQWENMGFDVTQLHRALTLEPAERFKMYRVVEENIRRAIECEKRIQMIEVRGYTVEAAKMRFRIMQLTGLNDIERSLDRVMKGDDNSVENADS